MGALPKVDLGGFHDRLGQRGMGVNGEFEVGRVGAHFDRQCALGDHLSGADTGDTNAKYPIRLGVDDQLRQAIRSLER